MKNAKNESGWPERAVGAIKKWFQSLFAPPAATPDPHRKKQDEPEVPADPADPAGVPKRLWNKTEQRRETIIHCIYWILVLALIYVVFKYVIFIIMPFVIGFAIALVLRPAGAWITRKIKLNYKIVSILLVILFYGVIGVVLTIFSIRIINYSVAWLQQLPAQYKSVIEPALYKLVDDINDGIQLLDPSVVDTIEKIFTDIISSMGSVLVDLSKSAGLWAATVFTKVPGFLVNLLFTIVSTFFITIDYPAVTGFIMRQLPDRAQGLVRDVKKYFGEVILQFVRSYALIVLITFLELSLGLLILGVHNLILVALVIALFDILPVVGTGTVLIPWAIICFINGNVGTGIGLLVIYVVIFIVRNIIEPKIVGDSVGLHPIVTLISMFVGAKLFGVIGLFGLPVSLAILNALNEKGAIRLFRRKSEG